MEKKIVVPEGVWSAVNDSTKNMTTGQWVIVRDAVEAALHWICDYNNEPRTPNAGEAIHDLLYSGRPEVWVHDESAKVNERIIKAYNRGAQEGIDAFRDMFIAKEPPVDPLVMYIERHFEDSYADKRSLRNRAEAAVDDWKEHVKRNSPTKAEDVSFSTGVYFSPKSNDFPVAGFTEPEYPAEIKDYMAWAEVYFGDHPQLSALKDVLSGAYRRGQNSAK